MLKYKNIDWYYYQGALLPNVPPSFELDLTQKEQKELLKISKALFLRWTNEWDRDGGEFWYVIKDVKEDLSSYKSKIRNQIKKGLNNCNVNVIDKEFLANNGYEVYKEAFQNYKGKHSILTEAEFKKSILDIDDTTQELFGVFSKDDILIGYSQNIIMDEKVVLYSTVKLHPQYLSLYGSYALFFEMNRYYLNEREVLYVSDGARSISHESNVQEYLIKKINFRKAYCRLKLAYRWDINILVKVLYPFRRVLKIKKIEVLLKQEEIRRSFE